MSLLPDKIKTFDYYVSKLPLYLRNSNKFREHLKIWYDILVGRNEKTGIEGVSNSLLALFNIFDEDYLNFLLTFEDISGLSSPFFEGEKYGKTFEFLDKLGYLYGISRKLSITYKHQGTMHTENISLSNEDFLTYIKFQIIKNNCEGTRFQIEEFYKSAGLTIYMIDGDSNATVNIYLVEDNNTSDNLRKLFLAGELIIKSMGILYDYSSIDISNLFIWDQINNSSTNGWDGGLWGI